MIAWKMKIKSPECPDTREIIVIANDITCFIGTFGPKEDILYKVAQAWRQHYLPITNAYGHLHVIILNIIFCFD